MKEMVIILPVAYFIGLIGYFVIGNIYAVGFGVYKMYRDYYLYLKGLGGKKDLNFCWEEAKLITITTASTWPIDIVIASGLLIHRFILKVIHKRLKPFVLTHPDIEIRDKGEVEFLKRESQLVKCEERLCGKTITKHEKQQSKKGFCIECDNELKQRAAILAKHFQSQQNNTSNTPTTNRQNQSSNRHIIKKKVL
jgi:hypothetical protein